MLRSLIQLLMVLLVVFAAQLAQLGWMWCEEGIGLHPAIAFPGATLEVVFAIWIGVAQYKEWKQREHAAGKWVAK